MGNRLSKIVTRTGDAGTTGLGDGSRVGKDSLRVEAMGEVDELNSALGVLLSEEIPAVVEAKVRQALTGVQHDLFDLGGELCIPGTRIIGETHIARLENLVEDFNAKLMPLKEFILPGGTGAAAVAHLARTICRRAERRVVQLGNEAGNAANARDNGVENTQDVSPFARQYLNRLSDLLFVLGRVLNKAAGCGDVQWAHGKTRGE